MQSSSLAHVDDKAVRNKKLWDVWQNDNLHLYDVKECDINQCVPYHQKHFIFDLQSYSRNVTLILSSRSSNSNVYTKSSI